MPNALTVEAPEGQPFIDYEREFDAPVQAVMRAHADPEVFVRWMATDGNAMEVPEWEFAPYGRFRFVEHASEGDWAFRGTFHTVRDDLIIQTFEFEGMPDVVSVETLRFESIDDGRRTRLRGHSTYPSVESRDGMAGSGMENGMRQVYDQLEALLV